MKYFTCKMFFSCEGGQIVVMVAVMKAKWQRWRGSHDDGEKRGVKGGGGGGGEGGGDNGGEVTIVREVMVVKWPWWHWKDRWWRRKKRWLWDGCCSNESGGNEGRNCWWWLK
jgi:hypothetical protein